MCAPAKPQEHIITRACATLAFSAWESGGWINVAVIAVMALVVVLLFVWARSRKKPPPGPDGVQRKVDRLTDDGLGDT